MVDRGETDPDGARAEAIELLQQLGLKEYEAKCFVGLTQLSVGTAKQLSEVVDVPRTRVYDAIRMLEAQGLVEIHHSTPQRFRAVPLEEAVETLRRQYDDRVDRLERVLAATESLDDPVGESPLEVWTLTDERAILNRSGELVAAAAEEVILIAGDERVVTDELLDRLADVGPGVDLRVGAPSDALEARLADGAPDAATVLSGLEWLQPGDGAVSLGRLLLVDRGDAIVSTVVDGTERAVFGRGPANGVVVVLGRMLAGGQTA